MDGKKYEEFECLSCGSIVFIKYGPRGLEQNSHPNSPNEGMLIGKRCMCRACACPDDDLTLENICNYMQCESNLYRAKKYLPDPYQFVKIMDLKKMISKKMAAMNIPDISCFKRNRS